MIKPSDIQRMFELVDGVLYWLPRPYSDFRTRYACKHWNEHYPLTTFEDGDEIRIKGVGRKYSHNEIVEVMNTRLVAVEPVKQVKRYSRELAKEAGRETYIGVSCVKCGGRKRRTSSGRCVRCLNVRRPVRVEKRKFTLDRSEIAKRFELIDDVLHWRGRPSSDFKSDVERDEWREIHRGEPVKGDAVFYVEGKRYRKTIEELTVYLFFG